MIFSSFYKPTAQEDSKPQFEQKDEIKELPPKTDQNVKSVQNLGKPRQKLVSFTCGR